MFESQRLKLCKLMDTDADALFKMYSDSDAMKYRGSDPMAHIDEAFKMIAESSDISKSRLGIIGKSNNQLIGTLLLKRVDGDKVRYEVGFSFGKQHWGYGYGQEILKMVEDHLKVSHGADEICAWVVKENSASVRIFEKAKFHILPQNTYPESNLYLKKLS